MATTRESAMRYRHACNNRSCRIAQKNGAWTSYQQRDWCPRCRTPAQCLGLDVDSDSDSEEGELGEETEKEHKTEKKEEKEKERGREKEKERGREKEKEKEKEKENEEIPLPLEGGNQLPDHRITVQRVLSYIAETLAGITPAELAFETVAVALVIVDTKPCVLYATNSGGKVGMTVSESSVALWRDYQGLTGDSLPKKPKGTRKLNAWQDPHDGFDQPKIPQRLFQSAARLQSLAKATQCPPEVDFNDWHLISGIVRLLKKDQLIFVPQPIPGIRIHGEMVLADHIFCNQLQCAPLRAFPIAASKQWCGHCLVGLGLMCQLGCVFDFEGIPSHFTGGKYWYMPPILLKNPEAVEGYFSKRALTGGLTFHWNRGYIECTKQDTYAPNTWQIRSLSPFRQ